MGNKKYWAMTIATQSLSLQHNAHIGQGQGRRQGDQRAGVVKIIQERYSVDRGNENQ